MTAEKQDIQDIKQSIISNRIIQIVIAIGTTVAAGRIRKQNARSHWLSPMVT